MKNIKSNYIKSIQQDFNNQSNQWNKEDVLLQNPSARRWMQHIKKTVKKGWYTFQFPSAKRDKSKILINDQWYLSFSSYDYLGLIGHPEINNAAKNAIDTHGTGTGGVRLLSGSLDIHDELEMTLSSLLNTDSSMVLSSGYMANLALIPTLLNRNDVIIADEYAHRSLREATKLSDVSLKYFNHNCLNSLEEKLKEESKSQGRICIIVEGIYSMDGDICPLPEIIKLKEKYGALLIVDEAHSIGVLGETGAGVFEHFNLKPNDTDIITGSLAKAIPCSGGFISGSKRLIHFLKHDSPPFIFSAALSPSDAASSNKAIEILRMEKWRRDVLKENSSKVRNVLNELGYSTGKSETSIIPIIFENLDQALFVTHKAWHNNLAVNAVTYPAVPSNVSRIRLCCSALHSNNDIDSLLDFFDQIKKDI